MPPKWPIPTDKWIRANAFWEPPVDWIPIGGLPSAPADWQFWKPNPQFQPRRIATDATLAMWRRISNVLATVMVVTFAVNVLLPLAGAERVPTLAFIVSAAACGNVVCLLVRESRKAQLIRHSAAHAAIGAAEERQRRLVRDYQAYLADPG
ncbi:hypothetical protein [Microbacterium sp. zg-YB36]|uniref:hypothetical protein n=1 Tax=Microbacterium sp. zg-YB36 TaxID=2969407 RepID=UPI00214BC577|nr:hypothetical protein [Microbacterium sp. zg-YB36]MDL5351450.1 hypothetical protein [Microbacterium sp. zg-YB36]